MMNSIEKAIERLMNQSGKLTESNSGSVEHIVENITLKSTIQTADRFLKFDFDKLKKLGYVIPEEMYSTLAEEFRVVKRPILRNAAGKGASQVTNSNLVMLTSTLPGEGKSFMTLNLALSIVAEKDITVMLVDCDLVNPTLSRNFNLTESKGITDVLNDKNTNLEDVIYQTDIENLRFVPAGNLDAYSTELLASKKMQQVTQELSQRYNDRIIIFDSPPILIASQATVLSHVMGQVLVVVEAGSTPQYLVKETLSLLDSNEVVGVVLNKSRSSTMGGYYYGAYREA